MDFFIDLARYLAVVMLELVVLLTAGWLVLGRRDPEIGNDSKTVPPD
jgi:hypothetical protein